jgi:N utilization substance protein A
MNRELIEALEMVEKEKGISKVILIDAIESALSSAYKKDQKNHQNIKVHLDPDTGDFRVFSYKQVAAEVEDERLEITLEEARQIDPSFTEGDIVEMEIFPKEFGRIAAQTAKQVVVQRIREAERSMVHDEFSNRVGDIITGMVQRFEQRTVYIDLGRVEAVLPPNEQIPGERYEQGMRVKAYLVEVKKTSKGPQVILSRTRNGLLKRLFELEVPEIQDGIVEIKSVAREPGARSKVAVYSRHDNVDPVGACVGAKGARVQMIVRELKGEKIDVIPWNSDPVLFIIKAMSPAKVADVRLFPSRKTALVIVPDYQLSLAIGKEGQNARLAAKLTGWKIDIKSETQADEAWDDIQAMLDEEEALRPQDEPAEEVYEEELYSEDEPIGDEAQDDYYEDDEPQEDDDEAQFEDEVYEDDIYEEPKPEIEEQPEEFKKKVKKPKTKRRERSQELADEVEEGIDLFVDVYQADDPNPAEANDASEVVFSSEEGGFTLGQLLAAELKKKGTTDVDGKKTKGKAESAKTKEKAATAKSSGRKKKKGDEAKSDEG